MFFTQRLAAKLRWAIAAALLLAPSAWYAIRYAGMPHIGATHDDVVYLGSARSLAETGRYDIPHLPERPPQVKYPPAYPALLAAAWAVNGSFPENLSALSAVHWLTVPLFIWLVWRTFLSFGLGTRAAYALTFLLAAAPTTVVFSTSLMTEVPFTAAVLAAFLLIGSRSDSDTRRALAAGAVTAAAFLIRTNGIAVAVGIAAMLLQHRKWRALAWYCAPVAVALAAWQWWCFSNAIPIHDDRTAYYASYAAFLLHTFSWADVPVRAWINVSTMLEGMGELVLFQVEPGQFVRALQWVIAVGAISGCIVLYRRGIRPQMVFAIAFLAMLVLWPYPIDRFVYPLAPLVLAGLYVRLRSIADLALATWKRNGAGDRTAALIAAACIALLMVCSAGSTAWALSRELPAFYAGGQTQRDRLAPAYAWIRTQAPADATFAAYDDGLLYLFTGRRGYTAPVMPSLLYRRTDAKVEQFVEDLPRQWAADGVTHILVTAYDFRRDLHAPAIAAMRRLVADSDGFRLEYSDTAAQVYRFLGPRSERKDLLTNRVERQAPLLNVRDVP